MISAVTEFSAEPVAPKLAVATVTLVVRATPATTAATMTAAEFAVPVAPAPTSLAPTTLPHLR